MNSNATKTEERLCATCKHNALRGSDEPCGTCLDARPEWEPKDEPKPAPSTSEQLIAALGSRQEGDPFPIVHVRGLDRRVLIATDCHGGLSFVTQRGFDPVTTIPATEINQGHIVKPKPEPEPEPELPFKIGDRVKVIGYKTCSCEGHRAAVGKIGVINSIVGNYPHFWPKEIGWGFLAEDLELCPELPLSQRIKVGDTTAGQVALAKDDGHIVTQLGNDRPLVWTHNEFDSAFLNCTITPAPPRTMKLGELIGKRIVTCNGAFERTIISVTGRRNGVGCQDWTDPDCTIYLD